VGLNSISNKKISLALGALLLLALNLLGPGLLLEASAQTKVPTTSTTTSSSAGGDPSLSTGAAATQNTDQNFGNAKASFDTLVRQAAEQGEQQTIQNTNQQLLQGTELGAYNDTYAGITKFWGDDIIGNLFQNIGQLFGRWLVEFVDGWVSQTVHFLSGYLRTFVLNPNVAVNGIQNGPGAGTDDISPYVREGADTMYGIAVDLLLLLFILCIWKYWAEAAWRGGAGLLGAVGRLIFTAGLMLAWPTIYAFEIQITNEMINAIFFNSADQVAMLDAALSTAVRAGLVASTAVLANAFAPVVGAAAGGALGGGAGGVAAGTIGDVVAFAGLIIYLFLGVVLIAEMVYIIVLKAIQTALLTAQYMFAPIFLVFFATPDTENVTSGFVRSFVEVSLWTFVWVGLLKIMVIILYSDFNPWGKIIMAVGVLQIMIQVPSFLARAQISPMSDFISAGMLTGGLMKGMGALSGMVSQRGMQAVDYFNNQKLSARGLAQSKTTGASGADASNPELVNSLATAGKNKPGEGDGKIGDKDAKTGAEITPPLKNTLGAAGAAGAGTGAAGTGAGAGAGVPNRKFKTGLGGAGLATAVGVGGAALMAGAGANKTGETAQTDADKAKANEANAELKNEIAQGEVKKDANGNPIPPMGPAAAVTKAAMREDIMNQAAALQQGNMPINPAGGATGATGQGQGQGAALTGVAAIAAAAAAKRDPNAASKPLAPGDQAKSNELKLPGAEVEADSKSAAAEALGLGTATQDVTAKRITPAATAQANPQGLGTDGKALSAGGGNGAQTGTPEVKTNLRGEINQAAAALAGGAAGGRVQPPVLPKLDAQGKPIVPNAHQNSEMEVAGDPETVNALRGDGEQIGVRVRPAGADARSLTSADLRGGGANASAPMAAIGGVAGVAAAAAIGAGLARAPLAMTASTLHSGAVKPIASQAMNPMAQLQGNLPDPTMATGTENTQAVLNQAGAHNLTSGPVTNTLGVNATPVNQAGPNAAGQHQQANMSVAGHVIPPANAGAGLTAAALAAAAMATRGGMGTGAPSNPGEPRVLAFGNAGSGEGGGGGTPSDISITGGPGGPGGPGGGGAAPTPSIRDFDQPAYRWVPVRNLATDIRTAVGPQMGNAANGQASISMGSHGVSQVRFAPEMNDSQRAIQLMAAGYAGAYSSDPVAFDAARQSAIDAGGDKPHGLGQNIAAGMLGYAGKNFSQTAMAKQQFQQTLYEQAAQGAQSYVNKQPGNAYTSYLEGRYGQMDDEQQAWGVHMMTDRSSPESGWSTTLGPATTSLVNSGIGINAVNRSAASNAAVFQTHPAGRPNTIRAIAAYGGALVNEQMGPNPHPLERDAAAGRIIPNIPRNEVDAAKAIFDAQPTIEQGMAAASNIGMVQSVAALVSESAAQGIKTDAAGAYRALSGVSGARASMSRGAGSQTIDVVSGGGSSGFAPQSMGNMGSMPTPPAFGGNMMSDATIDTNFRDAGGAGGNFNVGNIGQGIAYVPGVGQIGNTTMRAGGGFSGAARQNVNASMDVVANLVNGGIPAPPMNPNMAGMAPINSIADVQYTQNIVSGSMAPASADMRTTTNVNVNSAASPPGYINPPSLPSGGLGAVQRTIADVVFNQNAGPAQSGGTQNYDMTSQANAGPIEQIISSRGNGPESVMRTQMNVNAQIIPPNVGGGAILPTLGALPNASHIRHVMNVDINSSTSAPNLSDITQSVDQTVTADATHGAVDMNVSGAGGGGGSNSFVQQGFAEVFVNQQASAGNQAGYMSHDVAAAGAAAAHAFTSNPTVDKAVTIQLFQSGFSADMLANPNVASVAMQVQASQPQNLGYAAIAAKVLQPAEMNMRAVEAVYQRVEVQGQSARSIGRDDIISQIAGIPYSRGGGGNGGGGNGGGNRYA
jgi:hypothetical protein